MTPAQRQQQQQQQPQQHQHQAHRQSLHQGSTPLNFPEIRTRIARFLDINDCLACICVSRDWHHDFIASVWFTIDFSNEKHLPGMAPAVLHKYGHLIKTAPHLTCFEQVRALQHPKVDGIRSLNIFFGDNQHYRELVADLVRRCKGDITDMAISCSVSDPDTVVEQRKHGNHFIQVNTLVSYPMTPRSCAVGYGVSLQCLTMRRICLTREGFSALLRYSPVLRNLKLFQVVVLDYNPAFELTRESSVTSLEASLGEIWMPNSEDTSAPSFLAHLPLQLGHGHCAPKIAEYCPFLNTLRFGDAATDNLSELLIDCFQLVESCTFSAKNLELVTTMACINHMQTMTSVTIMDELPPGANYSVKMKWAYFIPYLSIEKLVLDVDTVQKHQWSCRDLRELRVQFKGLESEEDVERCVMEVCAWRRLGASPPLEETMVSRVVHHLFQFDRLVVFCTGSKEFSLPL